MLQDLAQISVLGSGKVIQLVVNDICQLMGNPVAELLYLPAIAQQDRDIGSPKSPRVKLYRDFPFISMHPDALVLQTKLQFLLQHRSVNLGLGELQPQ